VTRTCVNLRERFGRRYRVEYEESHQAQYGPNARIEDPWLMVIPCHYGHIYPHGGTTLAASVDGHPNVAGQLRQLACCRVHQDGDFGELTVIFDVADFPAVARVMKPRRRRSLRLTSEQRQEIGRRLRESRGDGRQTMPQTHPTARTAPVSAPADLGVVSGQRALFDL
jgi:hypothetical protein